MDNISSGLHTYELMDDILSVRFNDLAKLEDLCKQLLHTSEASKDAYGLTFANLYLFDALSSSGRFDEARFYLIRTQKLCKEYDFQDLELIFHNLAGLYYQDLFDEHAAANHYMQGLKLVQRIHDPITESKLYNNLGLSFRRRYDNVHAIQYFKMAYEKIEPFIDEDVKGTAVSMLCNIAEVSQALQRKEESAAALRKAEKLNVHSQYWEYHLAYSWCGHYSMCMEKETCISIAKQLLEDGLCDFEHPRFLTGAYFELFDYMLHVDCQELAYIFLQLLEKKDALTNLGDHYNYLLKKTEYFEKYGTQEECNKVYREFYAISTQANEHDNDLRVQTILAKIDLAKALYESNHMKAENKRLEQESHMDELTQVYNRRYLSKLQTKLITKNKSVLLGYIMIDVDYFKQYNDFYGHFKGDECLCSVANLLKICANDKMHLCRYGGDEFLVICEGCSTQDIENYIRQMQEKLMSLCIPHEQSKCSTCVTLSIGFANANITNEQQLHDLLSRADQALYQAKEDGRNCFRNI